MARSRQNGLDARIRLGPVLGKASSVTCLAENQSTASPRENLRGILSEGTSFNGKPKASAVAGNTGAFGLPLNEDRNSSIPVRLQP